MSLSRLALAHDSGAFSIPDDGEITVWRPSANIDLSCLPSDRVRVVHGFRPDHDHWAGRGYATSPDQAGDTALSVVCAPRIKALARALLAEAARRPGLIVVDGLKTDGIESLLKACRERARVGEPISKAHGKLFVIAEHDGFRDWRVGFTAGPGGFVTAPGVFSAGAVDPGSELLVRALPGALGRRVADLGAGWGYLSGEILKRGDVGELHLVEPENVALECARLNVQDARAVFHWADAMRVELPGPMDAVVMNPPFHVSRAADPGLGRAFVGAAARILGPRGRLWMVANRRLPYEAALIAHFIRVNEIGGDDGFKVLAAARPRRATRHGG